MRISRDLNLTIQHLSWLQIYKN